MKTADALTGYREYPHVITRGVRQNRRWAMSVTNEPTPSHVAIHDYIFHGLGFVDGTGTVSARGRATVMAHFEKKASQSKANYCVVWSPTDCTWFDHDGGHRDGKRPPEGEMDDPWLGRRHGAMIEWCWTIELPAGGEWSHLCVRRIDRDLVEVAPGEPMVLANFDEPVHEGVSDPADGMLAEDGSLAAPKFYRGQPVTGIREEWSLLGPVQAADDGVILRNPWPDDVRSACEQVAGMSLPRHLTDAAWRAIDPENPDIIYVGVQKAA